MQEIRALATLGGDGEPLLSMQYNPMQQRLVLAEDSGYTLWNLDGMVKGADFRRTTSNYDR